MLTQPPLPPNLIFNRPIHKQTHNLPDDDDPMADDNRRVWIPDATEGFLAGWVKSEPSAGDAAADATAEVVVSATGEMRTVPTHSLSPMNPPQFDGVEDIAELTHLNEASVVNNLRSRYGAGSIYVSRTVQAKLTIRATLGTSQLHDSSNPQSLPHLPKPLPPASDLHVHHCLPVPIKAERREPSAHLRRRRASLAADRRGEGKPVDPHHVSCLGCGFN